MAEKFNTDKIKEILEQRGHGAKADWKRCQKFNNAAKQPVRIFENTKTGEQLEVTEVNGDIVVKSLMQKATETFAKQEPKDDAPQPIHREQQPLIPQFTIPDAQLKKYTDMLPGFLAQRFLSDERDWELKEGFQDANGKYFIYKNTFDEMEVFLGHIGNELRLKVVKKSVMETSVDDTGGGFVMVSQRRKEPEDTLTQAEKDADENESELRHQEYERVEKERHDTLSAELLSRPITETDKDKIKLAKKIMRDMLGQFESEDDVDFSDDAYVAKIIKAGKAFTNMFGFSIGVEEEHGGKKFLSLGIAPLEETSYDQHLGSFVEYALPEGMGEAAEALFHFDGHADAMAMAREMILRGFRVSPDMQRYADDNASYYKQKPLLSDLLKLEKDLLKAEKQSNENKPSTGGGMKP